MNPENGGHFQAQFKILIRDRNAFAIRLKRVTSFKHSLIRNETTSLSNKSQYSSVYSGQLTSRLRHGFKHVEFDPNSPNQPAPLAFPITIDHYNFSLHDSFGSDRKYNNLNEMKNTDSIQANFSSDLVKTSGFPAVVYIDVQSTRYSKMANFGYLARKFKTFQNAFFACLETSQVDIDFICF